MKFTELLKKKKILLIDGAMGTQLEQRGATPGGMGNINNPAAVVEVQRAYLNAGSDILIANTFCMNKIYMETHGIECSLEEVNRAGVELAKKASDGKALIAGDIGPTGQMLEPLGTFSEQQFMETFLEQASCLAEAGVDVFIIETMMSLKEAVCAVRACSENFDIPVIVSMTFSTVKDGGRTIMGDKADDCAKVLENAGAAVIGMNCGNLDPVQAATVVASFRAASRLPIIVQPNAGKPRLEEEVTIYDMSPELFAEGIAECVKAGASIIGGCCGTTPAHIKALRDAF